MSLNSVIEQEGCHHEAIFEYNIDIYKKNQWDAMIFFPLIGSWTQKPKDKKVPIQINSFGRLTENTAASQLH